MQLDDDSIGYVSLGNEIKITQSSPQNAGNPLLSLKTALLSGQVWYPDDPEGLLSKNFGFSDQFRGWPLAEVRNSQSLQKALRCTEKRTMAAKRDETRNACCSPFLSATHTKRSHCAWLSVGGRGLKKNEMHWNVKDFSRFRGRLLCFPPPPGLVHKMATRI